MFLLKKIFIISVVLFSYKAFADTTEVNTNLPDTLEKLQYCYCPDTFGVCINKADSLAINEILKISETDSLKQKTLGELILVLAKHFLEVPYGTPKRKFARMENLLIGFDKFNCVTLVETVLALARCIKNDKCDINSFACELIKIRYRNGVIGNFSSRLHYFSEWLYDNEARGILKDLSFMGDSTVWEKKINYMTSHKKKYKQLKKKATYNEMREIEKILSAKKRFYVPLEKVDSCKSKIQNGDIIIITVNTPGLDVSHTGFAIWKENELYLLHASSKEKKVVISEKSLKEYLSSNKKTNGILISRPLE